MIIDCFIFCNELDLLEGRLEYLYNTVDYFIIVESNMTHNGKSKPLNYLANINRYKKYVDKILYYPLAANAVEHGFNIALDPDNTDVQWKFENFQRNYIAQALKLFPDDAVVLISDLDEIPNTIAIGITAPVIGIAHEVLSLEQDMYYYNFNQKIIEKWTASIISTNWYVQKKTPQWLRVQALRSNLGRVHDAGWHLSYWGGPDRIIYKIKNFAHQEHNNETTTNIDFIKNCIEQGRNLINGQPMIPTDVSTLDPVVYKIFGKY